MDLFTFNIFQKIYLQTLQAVFFSQHENFQKGHFDQLLVMYHILRFVYS